MAGEKEVVVRFTSEGLQQLSAQIQEVKNLMNSGASGGSAVPNTSAPIISGSGPVAPSSGSSIGVAQAASNAGTPRQAPAPINYGLPMGGNQPAPMPYVQPMVPLAPGMGTGQAQATAASGGIVFNPANNQYDVTNTLGKTIYSSTDASMAQAAAGLVGVNTTLPGSGGAINIPKVPTQAFYKASGMELAVGGQVVAQGIPGIASPASMAMQAQALNQQVMSGTMPVPVAPPGSGGGGMPGYLRGALGMPMIGMSSALGGYFLGAASVQGLSEMGSAYGGYAGRLAAGHTAYPIELAAGMVSPALTLGFMGAGMAVGSAIAPGPGTVIGGMVGMGLGSIANATVGPYMQQIVTKGVEVKNYEAIKKAFGYQTGWPIAPGSDQPGYIPGSSSAGGFEEIPELGSSAPLRKIMASMAISGFTDKGLMPVMFGKGRQYSNEAVADPMIQAILSGMKKPDIFGRYGYSSPSYLRDMGVSAVMGGEYDNPLIQAKGLKDFAEEMAQLRYKQEMEGQRFERSNIAYSSESRFGGYQASEDEYQSMQSARSRSISNLSAQITSVKKRHGEWSPEYEKMLTERTKLQFEQREVNYQREMLRFGETESRYGLREQRSSQAFGYARATGTEPESLPWQREAEVAGSHATAIRNEMDRLRKKKLLSPTQEYQMTQEAEAEEYRVKMIPLQKQSAVWDIREQRGSTYVSQTRAANMGLTMLGGPNERYEAAQREIEANQMLLDLERQRLANDKSLTAEKKEQLRGTIANLEGSQTAARIEAERAKVQGHYAVGMAGIGVERQQIAGAYAKGAGGAESTGLIVAGLGATAKEMAEVQKIIDAPSTNPVTRAQMLERQAGLWTKMYQQQGEAGAPPMSAEQRIDMSNLQTQYNIATTTFASYADMRGLLQGQMGLIGNRVTDLNRNRSALKAKGEWTPESEARYTEERNSWVQQAAGTQQKLEEGWLDRLVSRTWNEPGNFNIIASQFTKREASLFAGIQTRAFGGNANQSDYWRRQYPAQYTSMIGKTGTQEGFVETAMTKSGAIGSGTVEIILKVEDGQGRSRPQNATIQLNSDTANFTRMDATIKNPRGNYQ